MFGHVRGPPGNRLTAITSGKYPRVCNHTREAAVQYHRPLSIHHLRGSLIYRRGLIWKHPSLLLSTLLSDRIVVTILVKPSTFWGNVGCGFYEWGCFSFASFPRNQSHELGAKINIRPWGKGRNNLIPPVIATYKENGQSMVEKDNIANIKVLNLRVGEEAPQLKARGVFCLWARVQGGISALAEDLKSVSQPLKQVPWAGL